MESIRFTLNRQDLSKIGKGAMIAGAGAALAYAGQALLGLHYGVIVGERTYDLTPIVVAALSAGVNAARKWLAGKTPAGRSYE